MPFPFRSLAAACVLAGTFGTTAAESCHAESAATLTPVIELYTSEGCSSCPPADRWLSTFKTSAASGQAVVQAFHVGYWDYIGWVDRFAAPAHTLRQRQVASWNRLGNIYTPQLVRNGLDWRDDGRALATDQPARARIVLRRSAGDGFEATVVPADANGAWAAYWTVTEDGHNSKVKAGENAGVFLQHDFVVRQYVPAGEYRGPSRLVLRAIPGEAGHGRRVNLVVFEPRTGRPLQALGLAC